MTRSCTSLFLQPVNVRVIPRGFLFLSTSSASVCVCMPVFCPSDFPLRAAYASLPCFVRTRVCVCVCACVRLPACHQHACCNLPNLPCLLSCHQHVFPEQLS
ncbi:hypothetical protein F4782DRAFT_241654 [Xylaria castorea]|nr:hypothetical protein F4782DRAFT_241654 [Xylaria castorea]